MPDAGAHEAQNELLSLLDLVAPGREVVITRGGKPVARLVADTGVIDREKAFQAAADIVAMRKGVTLGGSITLKELIAEGRR